VFWIVKSESPTTRDFIAPAMRFPKNKNKQKNKKERKKEKEKKRNKEEEKERIVKQTAQNSHTHITYS
jgi:hypothetical protein